MSGYLSHWLDLGWQYLERNQFAGGGLFLAVLGAVLAYGRRIPNWIAATVWRRITVCVEVTNRNELFNAVEFWLARSAALRRTRSFHAKFRATPPRIGDFSYDDDEDNGTHHKEAAGSGIELSPGPGEHWFWHSGRLFFLERESREKEKDYNGRTTEAFSFRVLARNVNAARTFLEEAIRACQPEERKVVRIYTATMHDGWRVSATYPARPVESVVLPVGMLDEIEADVRRFYGRREWYRQLGIPYRRGYLLMGPPGNGKTSTIVVLAGLFQAPICVIDLGSPMMTDERLRDLVCEAQPGAFLLFEDIDAVFRSRISTPPIPHPHFGAHNENKGDSQNGNGNGNGSANVNVSDRLTLSGLLNALDGVASPEGRVVFMSTNHPERLDPALIRPGRVDKRLLFPNATHEQLVRMYRRFFGPDISDVWAGRFADLLAGADTSMARAQGLLLECEDAPEKALTLAQRYAESLLPANVFTKSVELPLTRENPATDADLSLPHDPFLHPRFVPETSRNGV